MIQSCAVRVDQTITTYLWFASDAWLFSWWLIVLIPLLFRRCWCRLALFLEVGHGDIALPRSPLLKRFSCLACDPVLCSLVA